MAAQSQWHGNIETSTDTLVPVDILNSELAEDQIRSELSTAITSKESTPYENGVESSIDRYRSRISPDVHTKSKTLPNGNLSSAMDESILIQPEHQQMDISNGNRTDYTQSSSSAAAAPVSNGNGIANFPLYRRRNDSYNSKPSPWFTDMPSTSTNVRSDSISPNTMNSKFVLPSTSRTLNTAQSNSNRTINTPSQPTTNISMISSPDGLTHALSEQNLRLQQIVHEHKASQI